MVSDPISDLLTRIRNGYMSQAEQITLPHSKTKEAIVKVLVQENYLAAYTVQKEPLVLVINLKYDKKVPAISGIIRVSKPGSRVYTGINHLPKVFSGLGTHILSTPKGVMGQKQARKLHLGGEVICKVW
jgi:small subunit ribosomal protein S8